MTFLCEEDCEEADGSDQHTKLNKGERGDAIVKKETREVSVECK
jgi:hypothetical protein